MVDGLVMCFVYCCMVLGVIFIYDGWIFEFIWCFFCRWGLVFVVCVMYGFVGCFFYDCCCCFFYLLYGFVVCWFGYVWFVFD